LKIPDRGFREVQGDLGPLTKCGSVVDRRRELAISTSPTGCCQQYDPLLDIQVPES
jgi:hypothetical protein